MSRDTYLEGELFEDKIKEYFEQCGYTVIMNSVYQHTNELLIRTATTNKIHGDGIILAKYENIFWDAKLHEFVSLDSAKGFKDGYYIISEKDIGGSKEVFDPQRIWVIKSSSVSISFDKILNTVGRTGLDYGPASGDDGLFLNLRGDNPGSKSRLGLWGSKISLEQFAKNGCVFDMTLHHKQALKDIKKMSIIEKKQTKERKKLAKQLTSLERKDYSQFADL